MVAVHPYTTGFDATAHTVCKVSITSPYTGTQTELSIVGNCQRFCFVFKGGHTDYRSKNFFLEYAHVVVTFQQCWLHIETIAEAFYIGRTATDKYFGAFFLTKLKVAKNFFVLLSRRLCTYLSIGIQWVTTFDLLRTSDNQRNKVIVHIFLNQCA